MIAITREVPAALAGHRPLCGVAPRTGALLEGAGLDVRHVDVSGLEKAEGAVTCCSLILEGTKRKEGS